MNTQPINTPDPGDPMNPTELDPVMIEKAREALWETFGAWPSGPLAAWLTERDCERLARAALSAAGVSALLEERDALSAEVERLRLDLSVARADRDNAVRDWRAALARATSAEQERDRLRADAVEVARALLDGRGQVAAEPAAHRILAGSGEQPGEIDGYCTCHDDQKGCTRDCGVKAHREAGRPAPVVPDSPERCGAWGGCTLPRGHNRGRADVPSNHSAPDSRDMRERVRGVLTDAARRESFSGTDIDALTDAVLAVVGQGVTAEVEGEECAPDCDERTACDKTGLGHSMCGRCEHGEPRHHGEHFRCAVVGQVPDSADVREDEDGLLPIEQSLASALWDRWADPEGMACVVIKDDPRTVARRLREWLLAVVGQGVTAEQAWDEGLRAGEAVERARWQWSAGATARAVNGLTERPERPANPYRAVVRPTGQEQADG